MGTRGYRVIRFRGRYYRFYNHFDSYPEGLGTEIVSQIPTDPESYQQWLAARRQEALRWETALERFLCKKRAGYEDPDADTAATVSDDTESETEDDERIWGEGLPGFTPVLNDLFIEWVYTIDLDFEVFTVDNGAHFHLKCIPRPGWIDALCHGWYGDRVSLSAHVPDEDSACVAFDPPPPDVGMLEMYKTLDVSIVEAKGLNTIPPTQRHGPFLRARIFQFLQEACEHYLSAALLSWEPEEFPFREIAYAVLCVASASLSFSLVPSQVILQKKRLGYADLDYVNEEDGRLEFLAHLAAGCHLQGLPPGSSPDSKMYWFEGALVYLVSQVSHSDDVVHEAVSRIVEACRSQRPNQYVNAILMSIEHILLMRVYPDGRVERTESLTLFDIPCHTSDDAEGRYEDDELAHLRILKEKSIKRQEAEKRKRERQWRKDRIAQGLDEEEELRDEGQSDSGQWQKDPIAQGLDEEEQLQEEEQSDSGEKEEWNRVNVEAHTTWPATDTDAPGSEDTRTTFMALTLFLEVCSRQQVPLSRSKEGVFPTEIYRIIILCLADLRTHRACMQVSRSFRDLCQENLVLDNDILLQANAASKTHDATSASFPAFHWRNIATGSVSDITLSDRAGSSKCPRWRVVVGSERNRRSLLPGSLYPVI